MESKSETTIAGPSRRLHLGLRSLAHLQARDNLLCVCSRITVERTTSRGTDQGLRLYHSLRAVKVLLAALRSTLTVLASQIGGAYRFPLEE